MEQPDRDLDRIRATGILAWLIYTGAGWTGAVTIWMPIVDFAGIGPVEVDEAVLMAAPDDVWAIFWAVFSDMFGQIFLQMLIPIVPFALLGAVVVLAARGGRRLPAWLVVALGCLTGLPMAALAAPPDVLLQILYIMSVAVGAVAMAVARHFLIQRGNG